MKLNFLLTLKKTKKNIEGNERAIPHRSVKSTIQNMTDERIK